MRARITFSIGVVGVAVAAWVYFSRAAAEHRLREVELRLDAETFAQSLEREFATYFEVVDSIRAFYAGSEIVDRNEFREFTRRPLQRHSGIRALEWVPEVARAERAAHEGAMRDVLEAHGIREWGPDGTPVSAGERAAYYPVTFVEPFRGNELVLGLDLGADPMRAEAIRRARDTGELAMTGRIRLVGDGGAAGLLVFAPIFRNGASIESIPERRSAFLGCVLAVIRVSDIVERARRSLMGREGLELFLLDATAANEVLHHAATAGPVAPEPTLDLRSRQAGRELVVRCRPSESYLAAGRSLAPPGAALGVVLVTGLLVAYLGALGRRTARVEQLVRERTRELRQAMASAETASQAKSRFLANMSHELRTPLNAVIGYAEMLEDDARDAGHEQYVMDLSKIHGAGKHLLRLINEVLDLSKVEAGRVELFTEPVEVASLVDEIAETVRPLLDERNNTIEASVAADVGMIEIDVTRLRQILLNLLSNAAKFTEKGSIHVTVERQADWIVFRVRDTGIGMTREQLSRVFDPFAQADSSTTRKYGGSGLGLAICRQYCRIMDGEIVVESAPGEGTTFTVRLPHVAAKTEAEAPASTPARAGDTVLVIDDDPTVHELITRLLTQEGFRVVPAASGEQGLRLARSEQPIAIILDVKMPAMDGWEVLAQLKSDPALAGIPVILQTMVENQQQGYALGATDYVVKPIDRQRLLATLRGYTGQAGGSVLVIEDDASTREMIGRALRRAGWSAVEAPNGRAAIEKMRAKMPDAILLDLMMPEMDGFRFLDEIRGEAAWADVPVLVITAKELTDDDRRRLSGRVQRILQKGSQSREALLEEIRRLVQHSRERERTP